MKILIIAASLRKDSLNKKLGDLMAKLLTPHCEVKVADFAKFVPPIYNGDDEAKQGLPPAALAFVELLKSTQGLIIVSPEYNYSTPGALKNLLDWISRARPMPLAMMPTMLASASPSMVGGHRGLLHTLIPLQVACNAKVFPSLFCLAQADQAFALNGELNDQKMQNRLDETLREFLESITNK